MLPSARLVAAAVVPSPTRQALMRSWCCASLQRLRKVALLSVPIRKPPSNLSRQRQR